MKYYFIDHSKVRLYYENRLVVGNVKLDNIVLKGVKYDIRDLTVVSAQPQYKGAYALTADGFVKWENPTREIDSSENEILKPIGNKGNLGAYIFCSNYICIDDTQFNIIKIEKKNIKLIEFENTTPEKVISPEKVIERQNELEIAFSQTDKRKFFDIAVEKDGVLYDFYPYYLTKQKIKKVIITKGT